MPAPAHFGAQFDLGYNNQNASRIVNDLGRIDKSVTGMGKSMEDTGASMGIALQNAAQALQQLSQVGQRINQQFTQRAIKEFGTYEAALVKLRFTARATAEEMSVMESTIQRLGIETQFSANQIAGAMQSFAQMGYETSETLGLIDGAAELAAASGLEFNEVAQLMGVTMRKFTWEGQTTAEVGARMANVFAEVTRSSNMAFENLMPFIRSISTIGREFNDSFEEIAALGGILRNFGLEAAQAGNTIFGFGRRLSILMRQMGLTPGGVARKGQASRLADAIGLSAEDLTDAEGRMLHLSQIVGNVLGRMNDSNLTQAEQLATLTTLFGDQARRIVVGMREQGEEFTGLLERLNQAGEQMNVLGPMVEEQLSTWNGMIDLFKGSFAILMKDMGKAIVEVMKPMLQRAYDLLNVVISYLQEHPKLQKAIAFLISGLGALLAGGGIIAGGILMVKMLGMAFTTLGISLGPILPLVVGIGAAIAIAVPTFKKFAEMVKNNTDGMGDKVNELKDNFANTFQFLGSLFRTIWGFASEGQAPLEDVDRVVENIGMGGLRGVANFASFIERIIGMFDGLVNVLAGEGIGGFIDQINRLFDIIRLIQEDPKQAYSEFIHWITHEVPTYFLDLAEDILNALLTPFGAGRGSPFWENVLQPMINLFREAFEVVADLAEEILTVVPHFLGMIGEGVRMLKDWSEGKFTFEQQVEGMNPQGAMNRAEHMTSTWRARGDLLGWTGETFSTNEMPDTTAGNEFMAWFSVAQRALQEENRGKSWADLDVLFSPDQMAKVGDFLNQAWTMQRDEFGYTRQQFEDWAQQRLPTGRVDYDPNTGRYSYSMGMQPYANVGASMPLDRAFAADMYGTGRSSSDSGGGSTLSAVQQLINNARASALLEWDRKGGLERAGLRVFGGKDGWIRNQITEALQAEGYDPEQYEYRRGGISMTRQRAIVDPMEAHIPLNDPNAVRIFADAIQNSGYSGGGDTFVIQVDGVVTDPRDTEEAVYRAVSRIMDERNRMAEIKRSPGLAPVYSGAQ